MSQEISTIEGKIITSFALDGKFYLSAHTKDKVPTHFLFMMANSQKEYAYQEYGTLLKNLWENYLNKGEKPKLLELTLTDNGLIDETLHYIAPGGFWGRGPLDESHKSFLDWLNSQREKIRARINNEDFMYLESNLDNFIQQHLYRKRGGNIYA
jgi:hypothetical protein